MPVPTWQRGRPWNQQGSWRRPSEWSPLKNFHSKSSEERIEDGHHCFCQHVRHHSWSTLLLEDQSLLDWCSAAIRVLLKSVKCMMPLKESSSESLLCQVQIWVRNIFYVGSSSVHLFQFDQSFFDTFEVEQLDPGESGLLLGDYS